jgi:serine/threonine protein phosphatase PrpC
MTTDGRAAKDARDQAASSQDVLGMTVALQWHIATNTSDPVALATSRNAETGIGQKDVVIVVCDAQQGGRQDTRLAAGIARDIFDAYTVLGQSPAMPADRIELAQRLSESIVYGLKRAQSAGQSSAASPDISDPFAAPARREDAGAGAFTEGTVTLTEKRAGARDAHAVDCSVIATVIHGGQLFVARYGSGDVFLLRSGQLQHLTDVAFSAPHSNTLEPDLGQLDLAGEDRVLLCTGPFSKALKEGQIKSVLRATPSSRKAAINLLDLAERANVTEPLAIAVADYVTGQTGVFAAAPIATASTAPATAPMTGPRRGTFRAIAASVGLIMLVALATWAFSSFAGRNGIPVTPGNIVGTPNTPAGTLLPAVVFTPTQTSTPTPTVKPTDTPAPTLTPTHTPTVVPTNTPEPTATNTPVPTRRPTRRPPTATPEPPTATPEPPTPTAVPVTETPIPTSPPRGGGQPAPTPQPGCGQAGLECVP